MVLTPENYLKSKGFKLRQAPGECLEWDGSVNNKGYGRLTYRGDSWYAHRRAWVICNGPIPDGLQVNHHCDNSLCVNPEHLYLGTQKDNMQDASRRGRMRPPSKLTKLQVKEIRNRFQKGLAEELAVEFGVDRRTINRIVRGDTWA